MSFSGGSATSYRATAAVVVPLLILVAVYARVWTAEVPAAFFRRQGRHGVANVTASDRFVGRVTPMDELDAALQGVAMENRTLIIAVLNKAYVEPGAMLDLFLRSLREGEGTGRLIDHLLFVAVDERAFNRCRSLGLHCHKLTTVGVDFSKEAFYMTKAFNEMMWRRTRFLGDVLRRGYSFVFTDMDVMWLRDPFPKLYQYRGEGDDLQMSCDMYYGHPFDNSNFNTGFYYVTPSNRTVALFDEWYASRNSSEGMKDQDVLQKMKKEGAFERLGLKVRYLETGYFSGFCQMSRDFREVITVHANCCVSMKVKIIDLRTVLHVWRMNNWNYTGEANSTWPPVKGICLHDSAGPAFLYSPMDEYGGHAH